MVIVLGGISLVASAGVGYVYKITEEPIALAAEANKKAALGEVLPAFDAETASEVTLDEIPVTVHTATSSGELVGYAVETATMNGFSGQFNLMVGFTPDGKVRAVKVLQHNETPGLGSKMADEGNALMASFADRNPGKMNLAVKKDGGDVDALTAATITSRAYVDAVARAFNAVMQATRGVGVDAATGATSAATDASDEASTASGVASGTASEGTSAVSDKTSAAESANPQIISCSIESDRKEANNE